MSALALALLLAAAPGDPAPATQADAPAPPAAAPAPSSTTVGGVTVEAPSKKSEQAFRAHVDQFVHGEARPGIGPVKQITEWDEPVCPETKGLTPEFNAFVTRRIKAVATRVGVPDSANCRGPDVQVVFTTEPQKVVDDMRLHHPQWLGYHYAADTRAVTTFEPPIKSWYVTDTLIYGLFRNQPPQHVRDVAGPHGFCAGMSECRMPPPLKSRFRYAVVVIDAGRTEGKAIGAVADEIAMIVLSRQAPRDGCSALPSVMDALDPSCPDSESLEGLTPYDEAFLKALYAHHDTELLPVERSEIEAAVRAVGRAARSEVSEPDPPAAPSGK
jgi:hypothetical protein